MKRHQQLPLRAHRYLSPCYPPGPRCAMASCAPATASAAALPAHSSSWEGEAQTRASWGGAQVTKKGKPANTHSRERPELLHIWTQNGSKETEGATERRHRQQQTCACSRVCDGTCADLGGLRRPSTTTTDDKCRLWPMAAVAAMLHTTLNPRAAPTCKPGSGDSQPPPSALVFHALCCGCGAATVCPGALEMPPSVLQLRL